MRALRHLPAFRVVATCREPDSCIDLKKLQSENAESLQLVRLDVTSDASIEVRQLDVQWVYVTLVLTVGICQSGCCGPSELQAQLLDLAHQCSWLTSCSEYSITRYGCG